MKSFRIAFSFLTSLPLRAPIDMGLEDIGRAAAWFPCVGLVVGGVTAGGYILFLRLFPPLVAAVLAVLLWVALTGGLHLDGLADCCDGLLASESEDRRIEIMHDPCLGPFGGIGLVLVLLLKISALAALASLAPRVMLIALALAAVFGRWMVLPLGLQPAARSTGLGAAFTAGLKPWALILAAFFPLMLAAAGGWRGGAALLIVHLVGFGVGTLARIRLGGLTGDVYGLVIELSEVCVLLTFVARMI
jgi:adenosylcobinamide-GDP ribazoletransferase